MREARIREFCCTTKSTKATKGPKKKVPENTAAKENGASRFVLFVWFVVHEDSGETPYIERRYVDPGSQTVQLIVYQKSPRDTASFCSQSQCHPGQ